MPPVPPLSVRELARQEAEALGLYVRHDPLQEHRLRLRRLVSALSADLEGMKDAERVVVGGLIEGRRKFVTRDSRTGMTLKVLDLKGYLECLLWPETHETYAEMVESDRVLLFVGQVSHRRGTTVVVDENLPLEEAARRIVRAVVIRVPCAEATDQLWPILRDILGRREGPVPVYFDLDSGGMVLRCQKTQGPGVTASEQLAAEIEGALGPGAVRFDIEPGPARKRPRRFSPAKREAP